MKKTPYTKFRLLNFSLIAAALFYLTSCQKDVQQAPISSPSPDRVSATTFQNGFYIINEGWFGHDNGSVNWFKYGSDTIQQMLYAQQNPGKELGVTTEYGAIFKGKLYLISKQGPLVVTNANTLIETDRLKSLPADGRAFLGLTSSLGLISTQKGVYKLNLNPLSVGDKISGVSGQTGSMFKCGNYIFVMSEKAGVVILNQNDFSVLKKIKGPTEGFTQTIDGYIWAAGDSSLYRIDTSTLKVHKVPLPFGAQNAWGVWNAGSLTASTTEDALFIAQREVWGDGGNNIYKYVVGDASSLSSPFATLPSGNEFYGCAMRYSTNNKLIVTAVESGFGQHYQYNSLYFYNPVNGNLTKTVTYTYFYFPALLVFN